MRTDPTPGSIEQVQRDGFVVNSGVLESRELEGLAIAHRDGASAAWRRCGGGCCSARANRW